MREITGGKHKTIKLKANEQTKISYNTSTTLDVCNAGDSDIWLSTTGEAEVGSEDCLLLPSDGAAYNSLRVSNALYAVADKDSTLVVVIRGW